MRNDRLKSFLGLLLVLILAGCVHEDNFVAEGPPSAPAAPTQPGGIIPPTPTPEAEEVRKETPKMVELIDPGMQKLVEFARQDLANRLSIEVEQVELREVREVTWPDASLGCPQLDMVYIQLPQEGYLIRLSAGGAMYFYHSGEDQDPFLCEGTSQIVPQYTPKDDEFIPPPDSEIDPTK